MRTTQLLPTVLVSAVLLPTVAACGGGGFTQANPLSTHDFAAAVAEVRASGKPAYYLGPRVGDLPLTLLDLVEENAPTFQVQADYGSCTGGDGGCAAPVVVSTSDWRPGLGGLHCLRLDAQLGVPAGVVMGELTLVTGALVVTVSDFRDRDADGDVQAAVDLLPELRSVGTAEPVGTLPPPTPEAASWMDEVCGTVPGREISHPFENELNALDNVHVPDFTVERLGGGALAWTDHTGTPVVIVVGNVAQVPATVRRLQPLLATTPSKATLLGLVTDPTGDKFNPRPVAELEKQAGDLPVPVGYAAVPLSAVWFLDSASNRGVDVDLDGCVVAFVDRSGAVVHFATPSTPDAQLTEWARALG